MGRPIVVRADWDEDAKVWVAPSPDMPALVTESESLDALRTKVAAMLSELIALDSVRADSYDVEFVA